MTWRRWRGTYFYACWNQRYCGVAFGIGCVARGRPRGWCPGHWVLGAWPRFWPWQRVPDTGELFRFVLTR